MFERRKPFRTLGTQLRSFGRRLMRSYNSTQVLSDESTPALPPPPSWKVQSEEPLMWQEESHFLPVDSQPQAEVLPDPSSRMVTPSRRQIPSQNVQRQTAPQPNPQQRPQPNQQQRPPQKRMSDDDVLSNILDFHERREQEREQLRLQRVEQLIQQAQAEAPTTPDGDPAPIRLSRRRMGVDYVNTHSLGGDETTQSENTQTPVQNETPAQNTPSDNTLDFVEDNDEETVRLAPMDSDNPEPIQRQVDEMEASFDDVSADTSYDFVDEDRPEQDDFFDAPADDFTPSTRSSSPAITQSPNQPGPSSSTPIQRTTADYDEGGDYETFDEGDDDYNDYTVNYSESDDNNAPIQQQSMPPSAQPTRQSTAPIQRQADDNDFVENDGDDFEQSSDVNGEVPIQRAFSPASDPIVQRAPDDDGYYDDEDYQQASYDEPSYDDPISASDDAVPMAKSSPNVQRRVDIRRDNQEYLPDNDADAPNFDAENINDYNDYDDGYTADVDNQQAFQSAPVADTPIQRFADNDDSDDIYQADTEFDNQSMSYEDNSSISSSPSSPQAVQREFSENDEAWDEDWMDADEERFDDYDDFTPYAEQDQVGNDFVDNQPTNVESPNQPTGVQRQVDPSSPQASNQPSFTGRDVHGESFPLNAQEMPSNDEDSDFVEWVQDVGYDPVDVQRDVMDDVEPHSPRSHSKRRGAIISEVKTNDVESLYDTHVPYYNDAQSDSIESGYPDMSSPSNDAVQRDYEDYIEEDDYGDYQEPVSAQWVNADDGDDYDYFDATQDNPSPDATPASNDPPRGQAIQRKSDVSRPNSPIIVNADSRQSGADPDVEISYPGDFVQRDWDDNDADAEESGGNEVDLYTALVRSGAIPPSPPVNRSREIQRSPASSSPIEPAPSKTTQQRVQPNVDDLPIDTTYETLHGITPQTHDMISREIDNVVESNEVSGTGENTESEGNQPNVDQIARDVYNKLRDRLRIERERRHRK